MNFSPEQPRLGNLLKRTFPELDAITFAPPAATRTKSKSLAAPLAVVAVLVLVVGSYLVIRQTVSARSSAPAVTPAASPSATSSQGSFDPLTATAKGQLIPMADRKSAGDVHGTLLSGAEYQLSSDAGQVVVLNYFASWCAPCQTETAQFESVYRTRKGNGVTFVGVDTREDPSLAASWLHSKDITFPVVYEINGETMALGGASTFDLPTSVLIDKHDKVAAIYRTAVLPADLNAVLDRLTAEK